MMMPLLLALALQTTAAQNDALAWDYADADAQAGAVTQFLVCLDGQATAQCATVPYAGGTGTTLKTFTWKLPAMTPGAHIAAVQACTAGASQCSSGVTLAFVFQVVLKNPQGLRLTKAGG